MPSVRRFIGIGATLAALGMVLTGCFPPEAAPPPPAKFTLAAGLWRTAGTAPGAAECHFMRKDATGSVITDVHSDHGARYVQTADSDSEFVTTGCQPWTRYDGTEQVGGSTAIPCVEHATCTFRRVFQDGDYIVGQDYNPTTFLSDPTGDVSYGDVSLNVDANNGDLSACHWQLSSDWTGTTVVASGDGNGDGTPNRPGFVRLTEGQNIRLIDCDGMFWVGFA